MSESKEGPRTVKVVDRRMFSADGTPREGVRPAERVPEQAARPVEREPPARPEATPRPAPPPAAEVGGSAAAASASSQDFLELLAMLARNAELLLVGAEGMPAQPDEARRFINWLAALEAKTAGNLSREEAAILSDLVFQLRAAYLQSRR
ncbi:MAG: DUF1844 domain-containing protein [Thermoanaerobaculales bacterium]|nr:DUF1844 domain-containing protein [Thermoanaerobaculales bacterium]